MTVHRIYVIIIGIILGIIGYKLVFANTNKPENVFQFYCKDGYCIIEDKELARLQKYIHDQNKLIGKSCT